MVRITYEDWLSVAHDNDVAVKMRDVTMSIQNLIKGRERCVMIAGPSGVGKGHAVASGLACIPLESNPTNYLSLLTVLGQAAGLGVPVLMQEADVIFRSERMLNVLKRALEDDPAERRYDGRNIGAQVIVTTNREPRRQAL